MPAVDVQHDARAAASRGAFRLDVHLDAAARDARPHALAALASHGRVLARRGDAHVEEALVDAADLDGDAAAGIGAAALP